MLRDSARRFLAEGKASGNGDRWSEMAELGWLAMAIADEDDGLGSEFEDIVLLAEEIGRALAPESLTLGSVVPARIIGASSSGPQRETLLAAIASGELRFATAFDERNNRYDWQRPDTTANATSTGWKLSGSKTLVAGGAVADRLVVSARLGEAPETLALFVIDTTLPGITRREYQTIDGASVADLDFDRVALNASTLLLKGAAAAECLAQSFDEAVVLLSAEALGWMDRAIELTVEYIKVREQFGRPLAEFQALQHSVAEMYIDAESAHSIVCMAMAALHQPAGDRRRAVSACKVKAMAAARRSIGMAVHLHGGMGITCEYPIGHYLQRVTVASRCLGDEHFHLERYVGR